MSCLNIMTQKLEPKYNLRDYYAITIQPSDKLQHLGKKPYARMTNVRQHFYSLLQECQIPYYINMEISEPIGSLQDKTTGGRLHYHGIIKFNNKMQLISFLLEYQYKLLRQSRLELSKINDKKAWLNYIEKQNLIPPAMRTLTNWDEKTFLKQYLKEVTNKETE